MADVPSGLSLTPPQEIKKTRLALLQVKLYMAQSALETWEEV
jgi:hypothetical protein